MNTTITSTNSPSQATTSTTNTSTTGIHPSILLSNAFLNENDINQLPLNVKTRLYDVFGQIEKEFESLYMDNIRLRAKLNQNNNNDNTATTTTAATTNSSPTTTTNGSISAFVGNLVNNINNPITTEQLSPQTQKPLTINTSLSSQQQQQPTKQLISPTATTTITTIKARNTTLFPKFTNNLMQTIKNSTTAQNLNSNHHHHHHHNSQHQNSLTLPTSSTTATTLTQNNLLQPTITTFKEQYQVEARFRQTLIGHKDGICDINCVKLPDLFLKNLFDLKSLTNNQNNQSNLLIGTASADYSSRLWLLNLNQQQQQQQQNAFCIQQYIGHQGSVNSIRFHPKFLFNNLVLTASGDCQAHIWQFLLPIDVTSSSSSSSLLTQQSSQQFLLNDDLVNNLYNYYNNQQQINKTPQIYNDDFYTSTDNLLRTPLNRYKTHTDVCIAADWLPDGDYIVTGSWDCTSNIYNVENGKLICSLKHDDQLTNINIHNLYNYILTSSKDTTFKLWDIRVKQQTINIYHGHTRTVNSAIFLYDNNNNSSSNQIQTNRIVTTSDDHTCKIWDLRYMKQAQCQINLNSSINRLCTQINPLTNEQILCLPLDNRDIKLYTLNGERITRLQRTNRIGHKRMITSICSDNNLLLSGSFDKQAICWSIDYNLINKSNQKSLLTVTQKPEVTLSSKTNTTTKTAAVSTTTSSQSILPSQISTVTTTIAALNSNSYNNNNTVNSEQLSKKNSSSNFITSTSTSPSSQTTTTTTSILTSSNTNNGNSNNNNNKLNNNNNEKFINDNSALIIANTNITTKKENLLNKKLFSSNTNERIKI